MSGYYEESDSYGAQGHQDNSGGGLRRQLEEALAKVKTLEENLDSLRQGSVTDLLKDKGIDPAVAGLIPKGEDPKAWLEKNEHLLAKTTKVELLEEAPVAEPTISAPAEEDPAVIAEREARAKQQESMANGTSPVISTDLLERMDKISSEEELLRFFGENGMPGSQ